MNLKGIDQIRDGNFYLEASLRKARVAAPGTIPKERDKRKEIIEKEKLKVLSSSLGEYLNRIIKAFPDFENLPEFYDKLIETCLDKDEIRKSLSTLQWASEKINELLSDTLRRMTNASGDAVDRQKKAYIGRVASIMKRLNPHLNALESSRRTLQTFPSVKTDTYTICIAGFPNVGKSTLLAKLTTAKPEIGAYAFTTKTLNIGYFDSRFEKVQVIDSPGTLARFEKMNNIEKQAYLAIKYIADVIIFVFDLSEPYPIEDQYRLYENIYDIGKEVLIYFSKRDIIDAEKIDAFISKRKLKDTIASADDIKSEIQKRMKKRFH